MDTLEIGPLFIKVMQKLFGQKAQRIVGMSIWGSIQRKLIFLLATSFCFILNLE